MGVFRQHSHQFLAVLEIESGPLACKTCAPAHYALSFSLSSKIIFVRVMPSSVQQPLAISHVVMIMWC